MKPLKHFNTKRKESLVPRLIFFSIFIVMAVAAISLDSFMGLGGTIIQAGTGVMLATGAAAVAGSEEFWAQMKNTLMTVDLSTPEKKAEFTNAISEGNKGVTDKLEEMLAEIKNQANGRVAEVQVVKHFYNPLLSEKENTSTDEKEKYRLGLNRYVRNLYRMHMKTISPEDQLAMLEAKKFIHGIQSTDVTTAGGYGLPVETGQVLFDALRDSGLFFSKTTVFDIGLRAGSQFKLPTVGASGHPVPARVAEGAKKPVSNMTFGLTTFTLEKYACIIPWTEEMDQDTVIDMEQIIRTYSSDYYGILFDDILFRGDANIDGIYDFTTTYQDTAGTSFSSVTVDDIIRAIGKLRSVDLKGAEFYMSPSVWAELQTKKGAGDGQYFLVSPADATNMRLMGYPVNLTDSAYAMSESGAAKPFITFGNLKKGYVARKGGIDIAVSDVASWDDSGTVRYAFQENLKAIRLETRVDLQMPFPLRIVQIRTAAA